MEEEVRSVAIEDSSVTGALAGFSLRCTTHRRTAPALSSEKIYENDRVELRGGSASPSAHPVRSRCSWVWARASPPFPDPAPWVALSTCIHFQILRGCAERDGCCTCSTRRMLLLVVVYVLDACRFLLCFLWRQLRLRGTNASLARRWCKQYVVILSHHAVDWI
jgi:hypothetical protein